MDFNIGRGEASAIEPNKLGKLMADAIRAGRSGVDYLGDLGAKVPMSPLKAVRPLTGHGLGHLMFGEGPELAESMSYGFPPYKGTGYGIVPDKRLFDLVGTPTLGAGAIAKSATRIVPKLVRQVEQANQMRKIDIAPKASNMGRESAANDIPLTPANIQHEAAAAGWFPVDVHFEGQPYAYSALEKQPKVGDLWNGQPIRSVEGPDAAGKYKIDMGPQKQFQDAADREWYLRNNEIHIFDEKTQTGKWVKNPTAQQLIDKGWGDLVKGPTPLD